MDGTLKQNDVFLKDTFNKSVFPAMLAILSANINVFVDGILVSNKLGSNALAAITISLPIYYVLCIIGSFFASGTAVNAARAIGDNDPEKSRMYYRTCVIALVGVSFLVTAVGLIFIRPIVSVLCSDPDIAGYVYEYAFITLIGALPKILMYLPVWYLRLDGRNGAVALLMAVMSVGNIVLDVLLVYVLDMGVFGAGLASVIATAVACAIGIGYLFGKKSFFTFKPFFFTDKLEWKAISVAGIPSALNNLLSTVRLLIINSILLRYFGGHEVAVFTAVSGIAGFAECITLGVPQAAGAMLGVFCGEQDNGSCSLLVRVELISGAVYSVLFAALCLGLSEPIRLIYDLDVSLFMPLLWLSLSVFPGLICTVLSGYYNMAGKNLFSNGLIFSRLILMTYIGLLAVMQSDLSTYIFLFFAEIATVLIWLAAERLYRRKHPECSRFLLMNNELEERGSVLNFSVNADPADICSASERISEFCGNNGMDTKTTMRVELAMEEVMTLITSVNGEEAAKTLSFDLRAFSLDGITGIRIRYGGKEFNPFRSDSEDEDLYMGITMLKKMVRSMYQRTFGVNTLQMTLKKPDELLKR